MFENILNGVINYLLQYGLGGLVIISFIGSTIFIPMTIEMFVALFIGIGLNPLLVLIFATIGSSLGSTFNYFIGNIIDEKIIKKWKKDNTIKQLKRIVDIYGPLGIFILLALPFPLPVDVITVFAGITRMDIKKFLIAVILGKFLHYLFYTELIKVVI